mmetsp:Transcript_65307/g.115717  ORF Transcript_65307/g.115717 Transcript_65307/m.115717 type:complete len:105 (+) Transcript_65307:249-563(+)
MLRTSSRALGRRNFSLPRVLGVHRATPHSWDRGTLQGDRSFELRSRPEETRRTDSLAINRCFAMILDAAERSLEELPLSESADDGFFAPNGSSRRPIGGGGSAS